jgi:hypothetical protein
MFGSPLELLFGYFFPAKNNIEVSVNKIRIIAH